MTLPTAVVHDNVLQPHMYKSALADILAACSFQHHYDTYDNPFERKLVLHKPYSLAINNCIQKLHTGNELDYGGDDHFTAVMVYNHGDYLLPHYDAEVHPVTKQIKLATYVYFLTYGAPLVVAGIHIPCVPNRLVVFDGSHTEHSMPTHISREPRVVITFSELLHGAQPEGRTRAYFIDQPDWTVDIFRQRNLRAAKATAHTMYRTNK
jgi:hypothetical protein